MFGTLADDIAILVMIAGATRLAVWCYKEVKRQQLQELQQAREAARVAEMKDIEQRIYAEITRNRTMQELNKKPQHKPVIKATGLFSDEQAQDLLHKIFK